MRLFLPDDATIQERSGDHYITGYSARFYNGDPGTEYHLFGNAFERFDPLAFNLSQEDPIECRWNHDANHVLGSTENGTLALEVDSQGLLYQQRFNPEDPDHQKVRAKIQSRLCKGSSIGFWITRAGWTKEKDKDVFIVKEALIRDVGPVQNPAYKSATASFRSTSDDLEKIRKSYEVWKRISAFKL